MSSHVETQHLFYLPLNITSLHFASLPGAKTHAGSWPTQEATSNHLYLWPWPSSSWLPTPLNISYK